MPNYLKKITFDRDSLYERIWKTPISRLAKDFAISDVGLAKICRKLNIPRPSRGYWEKLEYGKATKIPRLPCLNPGEPTQYTHQYSQEGKMSFNINQPTRAVVFKEKKIVVPGRLERPHVLVGETLARLRKKSRLDDYGMLSLCIRGSYVRVSPNGLDRAMRILDTLVKELESKGFCFKIDSDHISGSYLDIFGERITFSLTENARRIAHVLTADEKARQKTDSLWYVKRYDYLPTGSLSLNINAMIASPIRKKWSDSNKCRLEDHIAGFINGVVIAAQVVKAERLKREEEHRRWEEERKIKEEEEGQRRIEEARLLDLEKQAERWKRSELIREYIRAVECEAAKMEADDEFMKKLGKWLSWAKEKANQIDPIKQGLFKAK